jgi:hypothetical protein
MPADESGGDQASATGTTGDEGAGEDPESATDETVPPPESR